VRGHSYPDFMPANGILSDLDNGPLKLFLPWQLPGFLKLLACSATYRCLPVFGLTTGRTD